MSDEPIPSTHEPPEPEWDTAPAPEPVIDLPNPFGRYRIARKLGQGGMGAVYLAHDTLLDRPVALKIPHIRDERFLREARAAASFHHPNFCPIYDVGEIDGHPYLAMAYIE